MGDGFAHGCEYRLRALEGFLVAASHNGQRPITCALGAAAHGAVEELDAVRREKLGGLARGVGAYRGAIEDEAA